MRQYGVVMAATTELIVTIVAFIYMGRFLDGYLKWGQAGIIAGSVLGAVLGFVRFIIRLQRLNKENDGKNNP